MASIFGLWPCSICVLACAFCCCYAYFCSFATGSSYTWVTSLCNVCVWNVTWFVEQQAFLWFLWAGAAKWHFCKVIIWDCKRKLYSGVFCERCCDGVSWNSWSHGGTVSKGIGIHAWVAVFVHVSVSCCCTPDRQHVMQMLYFLCVERPLILVFWSVP